MLCNTSVARHFAFELTIETNESNVATALRVRNHAWNIARTCGPGGNGEDGDRG